MDASGQQHRGWVSNPLSRFVAWSIPTTGILDFVNLLRNTRVLDTS